MMQRFSWAPRHSFSRLTAATAISYDDRQQISYKRMHFFGSQLQNRVCTYTMVSARSLANAASRDSTTAFRHQHYADRAHFQVIAVSIFCLRLSPRLRTSSASFGFGGQIWRTRGVQAPRDAMRKLDLPSIPPIEHIRLQGNFVRHHDFWQVKQTSTAPDKLSTSDLFVPCLILLSAVLVSQKSNS